MDPAIQTNTNGINTLTKRVSELKEKLVALVEQFDALTIDGLAEDLEANSKAIKINATRIANLRKLNYGHQLDVLKERIDFVTTALSQLTAGVEANSKQLNAQKLEIVELKSIIADNANGISANANDIRINSERNQDTLGSVEVVSDSVNKLETSLTETITKLGTTDKVVDGCIIGIDTNTTKISNVSIVAVENRDFIIANQKALVSDKEALKKHTDNIELNAVQTKTNSVNIRTLSQRK